MINLRIELRCARLIILKLTSKGSMGMPCRSVSWKPRLFQRRAYHVCPAWFCRRNGLSSAQIRSLPISMR